MGKATLPGLSGNSPVVDLIQHRRALINAAQRGDPEPGIKVRIDADGTAYAEPKSFSDALLHQFYSPDPRATLGAMRYTVEQLLVSNPNGHPEAVVRVAEAINGMLSDMQAQAHNRFVEYAAKPGRRGKRREPHAIRQARRDLGLAAEMRFAFLRTFAQQTPATVTAACAWVREAIDSRLNVGGAKVSLASILGGAWTPTAPERREQAKPFGSENDRMTERIEAMRRDVVICPKEYERKILAKLPTFIEEHLTAATEVALLRAVDHLIEGMGSTAKAHRR